MNKYKKKYFILPYAVFFLISVIGVWLSYDIHRTIRNEIKNNIKYLSNELSGSIRTRMRTYEQVLKGIAGHYASNDYLVSRDSFVKYASELGIENNLPGVQAVGFSSYIKHESVDAHVADAAADGYTGYRLKTDSRKDGYLMVDIMYPDSEENRRVYGFDLTSEKVRAKMLHYAVNMKRTGLSGKIILKQETTDSGAPAGVLMSKPVYKNGELFGVISAPFRINNLMSGIFKDGTKHLVFKIYDREISPENLMYVTDNSKEAVSGYACTVNVDMYGSRWVIVFEPTERYMEQFDTVKPFMVLLSMLTIGLLVAVLYRNILTAKDKTYALAKDMAEKLVESEQRFHQMFEQASAGIVITGLGLDIMSCNKSFITMLNYTDEEMGGYRLIDMIDEDSKAEVIDKMECLKQRGADVYQDEMIMRTKCGMAVWAEMNASVYYGKEGTAKYIIFIILDISARKEAEKALLELSMQQRAILDNSVTGIMKVKNRRIEWVNKAFEELFGYREDEVKGRSTALLHQTEEEYNKFGLEVDNYEKMLSEGFVETQVEMVKKDKTSIWVDISGKLITGDAEASSIWVINDVTGKKKAQDELLCLNANLESKVVEETQRRMEQERLFMQQGRMAAMGEMIGAIAHQWRQPLNIVALIVQNICADFDDGKLTREEMAEYAECVIGQIQHMSSTIDDFRSFFIIDKKIVEFEPCRQISAVLHLVSAQMKANNISINMTCGGKCSARGIPNEFSQVMLNLISNSKDAFIANRVKNPEIEISVHYEEPDVVVRFKDNAGGISPDIAGRVFDPYFTTKKNDLGTGIGLYMSKMIINDHFCGSISFENSGGGVEFKIAVPGSKVSEIC